jgi:hypothetical protein
VLLAGPVQGRTYSLYGNSIETDGYFEAVRALVDECLQHDPERLVDRLAAAGRSPRRARHAATTPDLDGLCRQAAQRLDGFFEAVESHRAALPLKDRCSATLSMTREQYLFASVEIGLRNRLNRASFGACAEKLALLPHCLRDMQATCAARPHGLDTVCMACSQACYVDAVSRILRKHHVRPYIWMNASLKRLFREKATSQGALGMLGIACIPELVAGMRRCAAARVPVVGLPLDANRCARWLGDFLPNTVNLQQLELLVADR